jgi:hypothetical protein
MYTLFIETIHRVVQTFEIPFVEVWLRLHSFLFSFQKILDSIFRGGWLYFYFYSCLKNRGCDFQGWAVPLYDFISMPHIAVAAALLWIAASSYTALNAVCTDVGVLAHRRWSTPYFRHIAVPATILLIAASSRTALTADLHSARSNGKKQKYKHEGCGESAREREHVSHTLWQ